MAKVLTAFTHVHTVPSYTNEPSCIDICRRTQSASISILLIHILLINFCYCRLLECSIIFNNRVLFDGGSVHASISHMRCAYSENDLKTEQ